MKKTILLVQVLLVLVGVSCGAVEEGGAGSDPVQTEGAVSEALSTQGCTPLSASSATASGNDGNDPRNTLDDSLETRWSSPGVGSWIEYDLGATRTVSGVAIAWYQGNLRTNKFAVDVSLDGTKYTTVYSGASSGRTAAAETSTFASTSARRLRITFQGNNQNDGASISEVRVCGVAGPTSGGVVWNGDFETGSRAQWSGTQMVSPDRMEVVAAPARQGKYAIKITVKQGDNPINASGNRNELVRMTNEKEGDDFYYRWSTMFAPNFPSVNTWQLFTQWHHSGSEGSPPLELYVRGEKMFLRLGGSQEVWSSPLVRGQWQDFILHVKWASDPKVGFVEMYFNGQLVVPKTYGATLFPGQSVYLKVGLYRNASIKEDGVLYHDNWVQGRTLQDVQQQ